MTDLDPAKHVKYTLGLVLGVDDFEQEFVYLSGRDRWLARDLVGYGTVWGLHVGVEAEDRSPRVNVAPGVALTPCGRLVCVTPAQCVYLEDWLAAHEEDVRLRMGSPPSTTSTPAFELPVFVVVCYRECATDDVPIPGEPCRTEDTLSAPSRWKDDFRLELRLAPPEQPEEDAVRDFVEWLRKVPVVAGPGSSLDDLRTAIRDAARAAVEGLESPPSSPPGTPPHGTNDFLGCSPPAWLEIPLGDETAYFRAAFDVWVTELRPALRRALPGCECGCDGSTGSPGQPCDEDVVLLGTIDVSVLPTTEGDLVVADAKPADDQARRPYVLHTRMLQELLLGGGMPFAEGSPPSPSLPPAGPAGQVGPGGPAGNDGLQFIVAAGRFGPNGARQWSTNNLAAARVPCQVAGLYFLSFDHLNEFGVDRRYVVKGTAVTTVGDPPHTFEVVAMDKALQAILAELGDNAPDPDRGIFVRAVSNDLKRLTRGFVIEISDFTEA